MRMLEKAFGTTDSKTKSRFSFGGSELKGKGKEVDDGLMRDENGRIVVGTPDGKGGLATQGPLVRHSMRAAQILLSIAVAVPIFWAALALRPNPTPPPAGKPPLYILYVLSVVTLILLLYLFLVHPCTVRKRFAKTAPGPLTGGLPGMMVLPVQNGSGKKGKKNKGGPMPMYPGGKKGKKTKGGQGGQGDVQVNLIVDPTAFSANDVSSSSEDEEDPFMFDDGGLPGSFPRTPGSTNSNSNNSPNNSNLKDNSERGRARRKRQKRRTLMAALRLEEEWKKARGWVRTLAFLDGLWFTIWAVAFGFVISGQRCPTGTW